MQVKIEFSGLVRAKLGQVSSTLTLEKRSELKGVMLREILHQLEETFADRRLSLLEGEEIKPGILLIRKGVNGGRTVLIPQLRDAWVQDQEVIILSSVMAGG
jgi:hypothetical protein